MEQIEKINVQMSDSEKVLYEIQINAAKKYPRDIKRCKDNALELATMNIETAQSCRYAFPVNGKAIQGPSIHLARIIAQNWGNLIVESKVVKITSNQIISQGMCLDLETNYAVKIEVRKSILDYYGKRLNNDAITMMGNATNAICYRTAVFAVIPEAISSFIYDATKDIITGDLSEESRLIKFRKEVIKRFSKYNATEQHLLELLGLKESKDITQDQLIILIGIEQALKDGDATPNNLFKHVTIPEKKIKMKSKKKPKIIMR